MQRATVALGEALAHSVGPSEKRRLLAFTPPTFPWIKHWLRSFLHSPHSLAAQRAYPYNAAGGRPLDWTSDRHGIAKVLTGRSYTMSFGRRHPQAMEAIMCVLLVLPPGCQYAMPCTSMGSSMHARTPLDGALPVSGSSRPGHSGYLYRHRYCTCTCVEKSRFPQAHLGTFPRLLSERGCVFLASPSNGPLGDPISPDPPPASLLN